jgi:hypothetical protein
MKAISRLVSLAGRLVPLVWMGLAVPAALNADEVVCRERSTEDWHQVMCHEGNVQCIATLYFATGNIEIECYVLVSV